MKKILLVKSFNPKMLSENADVRFEKMTLEEVKKGIETYPPITAIADDHTAGIFSEVLGIEILPTVTLPKIDFNTALLVGQITGRTPLVGMKLPKGSKVEWWFVTQIA